MLVFPVLWLVSGFVIPVDFFPGPLRALVDWSPLIPLLMAPVRVATGRSAGQAVAGQVAWVVVLWLVGRLVLAVASRRLVVHGG
jgi:ABC-2 type transport system permease protein